MLPVLSPLVGGIVPTSLQVVAGRPSTTAGWVPAACVVQLVYTAYKNIGTTTMQSFQGIFGTTMACLNAWMLTFLLGNDRGVVKPQFVFADLILFVVVILALNFANNTKVFALNWTSYLLMNILDPAYVNKREFSIQFSDSTVSIAMVSTFFGCFWAIFAACLAAILAPFCGATHVSAHANIHYLAGTTSTVMRNLVKHLTNYYCGGEKSVVVGAFYAEMDVLREGIATLSGDLSDSWWEGFGCVFMNARGMLALHDTAMHRIFERLYQLKACADLENFEESHMELLFDVGGLLQTWVDHIGKVLELTTTAVVDGKLSDAEKSEIQKARINMKDAEHAFTVAFEEKRNLWTDIFQFEGEFYYIYNVAAYARIVDDYAKDVLEKTGSIHFDDMCSTIIDAAKSKFTPQLDKDSVDFMLRQSVTIIGAFFVGTVSGLAYTADIPATCALVMTKSVGATVEKSLSRLQGIMMGYLFGGILLQVACYTKLATAGYAQWVLIFGFQALTNYLYYAGSKLSTLGMFCAAFGAKQICRTCTADMNTIDRDTLKATVANMSGVVFVFLGLFISTVVDFSYAQFGQWCGRSGSLCTQARENFFDALETFIAALELIVYTDEERSAKNARGAKSKSTEDLDAIIKKGSAYLQKASDLGPEAANEPRLGLRKWPTSVFDQMLSSLKDIEMDVKSFRKVLRGKDDIDKTLLPYLKECAGKSFDDMRDDLLHTLDETRVLCKAVLEQDSLEERPPDIVDRLETLLGKGGLETLDGAEGVAYSINPDMETPESYEQDITTRCCAFITLSHTSIKHAASMTKCAISSL
jgi:hypothetical protein